MRAPLLDLLFQMMVKVKICGITNATDATFAVRAGADALGFNFVPGSPRRIEPAKVKPIVMELPPFVASVGVFADSDPVKIIEIMDFCGLGYVQLHGHETPLVCEKLKGRKILKAIRIRSEEDLRELQHYQVDGFLLDAYVKGTQGGTGVSFDWDIARAASRFGKIILAGGLRPENVAEAVAAARPYGVDVASGVEEAPGKKSKRLVEAFIRNAKSVDL